MQYNTEAVVIRSIPYGETDAIISLLTPSGTVAVMARGAKKPQSRFAAGVQLCVRGIFTVYQNRGMGNLQQFELLDSQRRLRESLEQAAYAAYFCELANASSAERPNGSEALYRQFILLLDHLSKGEHQAEDLSRVWETKVLWMLGASPVWERCLICDADCSDSGIYSVKEGGFLCSTCSAEQQGPEIIPVTPGLPRILSKLQKVPVERLGSIKLSKATQKSLKTVLRQQMSDFAGLSLKTVRVLDSLLLE